MNNSDIIECSKQIDSYVKGKLGHDEIDALWLKFLKNPVLYEYFEIELHLRSLILKNQTEDILTDAGHLRNKSLSRKRKRNRKLVYLAIAAAAAMVLIIFSLNQFLVSYSDTPDKIALPTIEANEMVAFNIHRSDDQVAFTIEIEMNWAIADAYNREYQMAKERLTSLLQVQINELQRVMIELNLGITNYNLRDYHAAEHNFLNVLHSQKWANEAFREKTWWYLANNYLKMGRVVEAREAAANAAGFGGQYQRKSQDILRKTEKFITDGVNQ